MTLISPANSSSSSGSSSPPMTHSRSRSRSSSPPAPASRRNSKLFAFPSLVLSAKLPDDDEEKGAAMLPGPSAHPHSHSHTAGHVSLRRRRMLMQLVGVGALLIIGGYWALGDRGPGWALESVPWQPKPVGESITSESLSGAEPAHLPVRPLEPPDMTDVKSPYPPLPKGADLERWGLDLTSDKLLAGLSSWPPNPPVDESQPALSELGHFADDIYKLGPLDMQGYAKQLYQFAEVAFPRDIAKALKEDLGRYLPVQHKDGSFGEIGGEAEDWDANKIIWQTDKDERHLQSPQVQSWKSGSVKDEGWKWDLVSDPEADHWIHSILKDSRIEMVWKQLPSGILRSDMIRYILLLLHGGIYSDTDTHMLKTPKAWGANSKLWRGGDGWLTEDQAARLDLGQSVDEVLGKPTVVVGIEADVGNREDWYDWWPRPIQIVQWTMASAPHHPIALSALLRIIHSTSVASQWSHEHWLNIKALTELARYDDAKALRETTVLAEPKEGGPVGIMAWTGPGVWTDAVLSYLRVRYGMLWTDLKGLREPLRVGDVVVLPVTGFSPGVGNFGSESRWDSQAMVEHNFEGSWKTKEGNQ